MTKHEAAWLSIRVTGLVVGLSGVKQFSMFFYLVWMVITGEMREIKTNVSAQLAFNTSWPIALGGAITLVVAAYFLFGGLAVHRIIMKEKGGLTN